MAATAPILNAPWPPDLDPSSVPFRKRTITILVRQGVWEDMTRLDDVTETDVSDWWNTGPKGPPRF